MVNLKDTFRLREWLPPTAGPAEQVIRDAERNQDGTLTQQGKHDLLVGTRSVDPRRVPFIGDVFDKPCQDYESKRLLIMAKWLSEQVCDARYPDWRVRGQEVPGDKSVGARLQSVRRMPWHCRWLADMRLYLWCSILLVTLRVLWWISMSFYSLVVFLMEMD
jgi:hypothetical protein